MLNLVHLTPQPQNHSCRHIRMRQHAAQGPAQLRGIIARRHPAAFAMRKRYDTIHVPRQYFTFEALLNQLCCKGGAIARRHYRDKIPRAHTSVFPLEAHKRRHVRRRGRERHFRYRVFVVERQLFKSHVVDVDMLALRNRLRRPPDPLPVTVDEIPCGDCAQSNLMARRHRRRRLELIPVHAQRLACRQRHPRNRHVVGRVEVDRRILGSRKLLDFQ